MIIGMNVNVGDAVPTKKWLRTIADAGIKNVKMNYPYGRNLFVEDLEELGLKAFAKPEGSPGECLEIVQEICNSKSPVFDGVGVSSQRSRGDIQTHLDVIKGAGMTPVVCASAGDILFDVCGKFSFDIYAIPNSTDVRTTKRVWIERAAPIGGYRSLSDMNNYISCLPEGPERTYLWSSVETRMFHWSEGGKMQVKF